MATIQDVAREAGVSKATVSHVFNGTKYVSPELARAVREAAERLGYHPSQIASSLKTKVTKTVGVVLQDMMHYTANALLKGVSYVLSSTDITMSLAEAGGQWGREAGCISNLIAKRVDGLIVQPCGARPLRLERAFGFGIPVVLVGGAAHPGASVVAPDYESGVRDAIRHLLSFGHERIAFVAGPLPTLERQAAFSAYTQVMQENGVPVDTAMVLTNSTSTTGGYKCMTRLLRFDRPPTAVFAVDLEMAIGCLHALREEGLSCPKDMSLVCIGDHPWLEALDPPLTSVSVPYYQVGVVAAQEIIRRVKESVVDPRTVRLTTQLAERGSVARPRG